MELRLGVQALAVSAIIALSNNTVNVSAGDSGSTMEIDWSDESTAGMAHSKIHALDTLTIKGPTSTWGYHGEGATVTKCWCKDKLPLVDVGQDVTCADGLKTALEVWTNITQTGVGIFDDNGITLTAGASPGETSIAAFVRLVNPVTDADKNYFIDVRVLSATEQNSAFSAAYAAGTFVASSLLVAAIALF